MRISQRMQAKQSQKLHISPQLQQSILVLQMNNLELAEFRNFIFDPFYICIIIDH